MIASLFTALFIIIGVTSLIYGYQWWIYRNHEPIRPQGSRLSDIEREKVRQKFSKGKRFNDGPDPSIDFTQYLIRKKRQSELREKMEYTNKEYHETLLNYDKGFLK